MLAPVSFPQLPILTEQFVGTLAFQELHRPGYRHVGWNTYQHMNMIPIDRPGVDDHFFASRDFPEQLPTSLSDVTAQDLIPVLGCPHQVILAITNTMAD